MKKKVQGIRFLCLSLAVLLLASICIWGFQTDWGTVKITRLMLSDADGKPVSSLLYMPKTASVENPAPVAIIYHGRSNQGHSNDTWSMELARRGFIVLSPDLTGGGESEIYGGGSDANRRAFQASTLVTYAKNLKIADQEHINLIGYSLGTATVTLVANMMPDDINTCLNVMGPFMIRRNMPIVKSLLEEHDIDVGIIKADCDQYDFNFIGDAEACRKSVSEALGLASEIQPGHTTTQVGPTSVLRYMEVTGAMHQTGNISGQTLDAIIDFETTFNTAPVALATSNQTWLWQQIFSGVACVAMMFLLAAVLNVLLQAEFFADMTFERVARKEQRGAVAWVLDVLFTFVIPAALFIPVSTWGMSWFNGSILASNNLNGIMLWLVFAMFGIGTIRMIIKMIMRKSKGEAIKASDYCLAPAGGKFQWSWVGKSLLLGIGVVCAFGLWMTAMEAFFGIDYQVWNLSTYLKPSPDRVLKSIPYMIIIFVVMFGGNINQRVLPSTGDKRKDMWIAVTVNTVLTASALFFLLLVQYGGSFLYGTGETFFKQNGGSTGALDFAFGYCYMMGGTTGVVTYLYRKHGNVLPAVIACAIFAGLFTTLGFTLVV